MFQSYFSKFNSFVNGISYTCIFTIATVIVAQSDGNPGSAQNYFKKLRGYAALLTLWKWKRNFNTTNMFSTTPETTTTPELTTTTEPPTWIYEDSSGSGILFAQIFAGISALGFVFAMVIVIFKHRRKMKRSFLTIPLIRDLRDIREFHRIQRAAESARRAAEQEERGYRDFLQMQEQDSETMLPFLTEIKEDTTPPPPSYDTLFNDKKSEYGDCEDESPPPRYSVCYSTDTEEDRVTEIGL